MGVSHYRCRFYGVDVGPYLEAYTDGLSDEDYIEPEVIVDEWEGKLPTAIPGIAVRTVGDLVGGDFSHYIYVVSSWSDTSCGVSESSAYVPREEDREKIRSACELMQIDSLTPAKWHDVEVYS